MRALRVDKMTYAALEATLAEYAAGRATDDGAGAADAGDDGRRDPRARGRARRRAQHADAAGAPRSWPAQSAVGGGSAPGVELPTWLVAIAKDDLSPDALEERLRSLTPPVIARIENDRLLLDLRTVLSTAGRTRFCSASRRSRDPSLTVRFRDWRRKL